MPPKVELFVNDTPARALSRLRIQDHRVPDACDLAPETVRNFLRRPRPAAYDGVAVHRVVPNFVIVTGALGYRSAPLFASRSSSTTCSPEFSNAQRAGHRLHGARRHPASASTSFFICGECTIGRSTVFAKVTAGMDILNAIASAR
jgi:cyclophilin family peptidyl-prolyl cis-trans isomerase